MPQENPFYYNLPASPQDFVGRWDLVDKIIYDLCRARPDSWAIIGGRRFGKSSVLKAIESKLLEHLAVWKSPERYVFPVLVGLKKCEMKSECHVYACILHELYRALGNIHNLPFPLSVTRLSYWVNTYQDLIRFPNGKDSFTGILVDLVQQFANSHIPFRLILLIDEVESVIEFLWLDIFFNQLRAMIYDDPLANNIKLVLTGATKFVRVKQSGSPLLNAVNIEHLTILPDMAIDALIERGGPVSPEVKTGIHMQSGGHPFIAQYLLYHLWNSDLTLTTIAQVEQVAHQMRQTRNDFQGWWESIGDNGQQAYAILAAEQTWIAETLLLRLVQSTTQFLDTGLSALCYHGLVAREMQPCRYRITGRLFYDWFMLNALQQISNKSPEPALEMARRVLNHLEVQAAGYSSLTIPASLKIQLEDQRKEVARLEAELECA